MLVIDGSREKLEILDVEHTMVDRIFINKISELWMAVHRTDDDMSCIKGKNF